MMYTMFAQQGGNGGGGGLFSTLISLVIAGLVIAGGWKVFTKAGQPGWAFIIPIYNVIVLLRIVGRPVWWIVLLLIPIVNFIVAILVYIDLAKSFGKGVGFALGLIFLGPIFIAILGFGSAQYVGPAAASAMPAMA